MKSLIHLAMAATLAMAAGATSCTGCADNSEKARQDSIRTADSLARIEAQRLDSIRNDSIAKAEAERLALSVGTFVARDRNESTKVYNLRSRDALIKVLKAKDFTVSSSIQHPTDICGEPGTETVVRLTRPDGTAIVISDFNVEIAFADEEAKAAFLDTIGQLGYYSKQSSTSYTNRHTDIYWTGTNIEIKGNKVIIMQQMEC